MTVTRKTFSFTAGYLRLDLVLFVHTLFLFLYLVSQNVSKVLILQSTLNWQGSGIVAPAHDTTSLLKLQYT